MTESSIKRNNKLEYIKKSVKESYDYFKSNYDRYSEFRKLVFESSLTSAQISALQSMGRPQIEFNILEAYISRLLGEFSKQEPDILVHSLDESGADALNVMFVQEHMKSVFSDQSNAHLKYEVYKDLLSGGFSSVKVFTDYENAMSFDQKIIFKRTEPTLTGFDKSAEMSHKGDGRFCFEMMPLCKEDLQEMYPDLNVDLIKGSASFGPFNWTYNSGKSKMYMMVDFYEKKSKRETIVRVQGIGTMLLRDYNKMIDNWDRIEVPPAIIGKPRRTSIEKIMRYRAVGSEILEEEETDFDYLPIVFIDGHSLMMQSRDNSNIYQMTRPYVYHALGAQRLKNFAGISLANEIENTMQHKIMVAKEAMPSEDVLLNAYKDVQNQSVLVYNSFDQQTGNPIPNPIREVTKVPAPPEIAQAFMGTDSLIQNILGSYDAALGINNNQLSGVAIVEAASQSNATAMPYIVGCLQGFQRLAQVYIALMPKIFITPKTMPVVDKEGKKRFVRINEEGGVMLSYDPNVLNVELTAGASFQVQKARAINMVKDIMQVSPVFQEFISEKGLRFILDNMDGKGIEELKDMTYEFLQERQMQQQQAAAMPSPVDRQLDIEQQRTDIEAKKNQDKFIIDREKVMQEAKELKLKEDAKVLEAFQDQQELKLKEDSKALDMIKALAEFIRLREDLKVKSDKSAIAQVQQLAEGLDL